jgi:hypothetical protein
MRQNLARTGTLRAPWSSDRWCAYFRANAQNLMTLPWKRGAEWTEPEKAALAASLQDFQLGESSEGRHLLARARNYADAANDPAYAHAMQMFIREEQRHARVLGEFLMLAEVPLLARTRLDSIFRWLRHRAGLALTITVLLTAEMIGTAYYQAVRRASRSKLLRRICDQLLRDEVQHTRFHAERLAIIRRGRSRLRNAWSRLWHRVLFGGSCVAVWIKHRRALRAGGLGLFSFWKRCWREMRKMRRLMDPRSYRFPAAEERSEAEETPTYVEAAISRPECR